MNKLVDGDYLFQTPPLAPSGFFVALTIGFGVLLIACALIYWRRAKLAPENPVLRRMIRRVSKAGMWYAVTGLIIALFRFAEIPYVSMPVWMYLLLLCMIGSAAYYTYDLSERYPLAVWKLQESHAERRYRPAARSRPEPQRPRPKVRGKRRR